MLLLLQRWRRRQNGPAVLPDGAVDVAVVADDAEVDVRNVHGLGGGHVLVDVGRGLHHHVRRRTQRVDTGVDLIERDGSRQGRIVDQIRAVTVHSRTVVLKEEAIRDHNRISQTCQPAAVSGGGGGGGKSPF